MVKAYPMGTPPQLLMYGSSLNKMKKHQEAFKVFKMNYDKKPKDVYTYLGMMKGHYFLDNKKEAIKFGEKGKELATDAGFKSYFDSLIENINAGKEVFN